MINKTLNIAEPTIVPVPISLFANITPFINELNQQYRPKYKAFSALLYFSF